MVIIPLAYSQELFDRQGKLTGVGVRLKSLDKVQGFLQRMFDLPSVQAVTMTQFRTTVLEFVATSRLLLLLSALIASVIGGLGVLNAMTMTVSERVREFGLMKAVGASPRDLFALTLLETGVLGLLGGIVGAGVTVAGGLGIESLIRQFVPFVPPGAILATSLPRILECVVASLSLAVLAGIYPAARAAVVRPARVLGRVG